MTAWSDYAVSDFLLFSPEVYWRLFALENASLLPWTAIAPLACLGALLLMRWRPAAGFRALCLLLAAAWAVAGAGFLWSRYAAINWAAPYAAPLFMAAALALCACALRRAPEATARPRAIGLALVVCGAALYPLGAVAFGRDVATAEILGVAPDPTAVATLGVSCLSRPGFTRLALTASAAAWLGVSAATLWALGQPEYWLPVIALAVRAAAHRGRE